MRELERKLLVNRGYEVAVAVDGMDGWNMLRSDAFDLVVTDVDMPRMDGIELVSRIKADPRLQSLPVMVVSYKDREEDRRRGLDAGADYYLARAVSTTTRCWMPSRTSSEGRRRENRDRQRFADRGRNPAPGDRAGAWPEVAWVASNGQEAVEQCARDRPDVVLMDLIMPVMDGVEATRRIMAETPCAIVVVTVDVARHTARVFDAMGYGALDAADTPVVGSADCARGGAAAAQDPQYRLADRPLRQPADADAGGPAQRTAGFPAPAGDRRFGGWARHPGTVVTRYSVDFPAGIVLVQHVDASFAAGMADWLNDQVPLPVRLVREGEKPAAGQVLLAGTDDHLHMLADGTLRYTEKPKESLYRPSIDVFFHSVAEHWRGMAVGVLLTGMGQDGARG